MNKVPDFYNLFEDNAKFETYIGEGITKKIKVGKINLPSGQIVACDPLVSPSTEPFINKSFSRRVSCSIKYRSLSR